jgi:DTW domain-containing protein YfiP
VAIALLDLANDTEAASALGRHFSCFRERYLAGKPTHQASITAEETESV